MLWGKVAMWLGAGVLGIGGWELYERKQDRKRLASAHSPEQGVTATSAPLMPPLVPQPRGTIQLPAPPPMVDGDALHTAATLLLTVLNTRGPSPGPVTEVGGFQRAYNATGPTTPLATDARYGAKTQTALAATIAPAVAPAPLHPGGARPAPPPVPAALPIPNVDVTGAAGVLAALATLPRTSDPRVSTFQRAYNVRIGSGGKHLIEDGKYGASSQAACQAVLNWMGTGLQAPPNGFGTPIGAIPAFPGGGPLPVIDVTGNAAAA